MIGNDPRYQAIIDQYTKGAYNAPYQSMDYTPSPYYNPIYDIRREQIKAGELEEGARFPKPLIDTAPKEEEQQEEQFDPCPPGYQLVDGVCQPDSMFQPSSGDGGETTPFESPYYGDIYLPMAGGMAQGDPNVPYGEYRIPTVNTELMRFAAQGDYQPTFGSSMQDLFRKGMQFSPFMGLLNDFGLGPSYTQTVTPRFTGGGFDPLAGLGQPLTKTVTPRQSILDAVAAEQAAEAAAKRDAQQLRAEMTRDLIDAQTQADRAKAQGAGSFTVGKDRKPVKGTGFDPSKAGKSIAGGRIRGGI
jgi:hypothetical protein